MKKILLLLLAIPSLALGFTQTFNSCTGCFDYVGSGGGGATNGTINASTPGNAAVYSGSTTVSGSTNLQVFTSSVVVSPALFVSTANVSGEIILKDGTTITSTSTLGGVPSVNSTGNAAIVSSVTLNAGTNVTLGQSGNTITINASGGSTGLPLPGGATNYWNYPSTATFYDAQGIVVTTGTFSSLTQNQIIFPGTGGLLSGSSNLTWNGGTAALVIGAVTPNAAGTAISGEFEDTQTGAQSLASYENSQSASYWNIYSGNALSASKIAVFGYEPNLGGNEDGGISAQRWALRGGASGTNEWFMVTSSHGLVEIGTGARNGSNVLDVSSGVAIGADYVAPQAVTNRGAVAPINGLLVEGGVSVGTTTTLGAGINDFYGIVAASGSITNNLNLGTMTGAGLSSCSGGSSAVTWNSSTDLFGCNTISGSGGGSSTLGVFNGQVLVSTPTSGIVFDSNTLNVTLQGGGTAYVTLKPSSVTLQGFITPASIGAITLSSLSATQPILYNNGTGAITSTLISATTDFTGTLQAAQFPALIGDISTSAGSLSTTAASLQSHITTLSSSITVTGSGGLVVLTSATVGGTTPLNQMTIYGSGGNSNGLTIVGNGSINPSLYIQTTAGATSPGGLAMVNAAGSILVNASSNTLAVVNGNGGGNIALSAGNRGAQDILIAANGSVAIASSMTVSGNLVVSSSTLLNNVVGTVGQVYTSGGNGATDSWTTISGGSGSGIVSPGTFTWVNNFGIQISTLSATASNSSASSFTVTGNGGFAVVSSSAGQAAFTEGAQSTVLPGGSGIDNVWADSTAHALLTNYNGSTSTGTIVVSTTTPTTGHLASWSGTGTLIDGGTGGAGATTLTGDVTGSGTGTIATTAASLQNNVTTFGSSLTITGNGGLIVVQGVKTTTITITNVSPSLPLLVDANRNVISQAINLSGTQATGVLAGASFPALTGDVTTASGALATTAAATQANIRTFTGSITHASSATFNGAVVVSSSVMLAGSPGTNGQVFTSAGNGSTPAWTTLSASVTSVTGTPPINSSGGTTPAISLSQTIGQSETITGSSFTVNGINGLLVTGATSGPSVIISTAPGGVQGVSVSSTLASAPSDGVVTVSSQTGTITFQAQYDGHLVSSGTAPSMGTCGSSPAVIGTDLTGHINVGSGVVTSCTLNFANTFINNAPDCIASTNSTAAFADVTTVSTTSVTFGLSATLGSGVIWYHCFGEKG